MNKIAAETPTLFLVNPVNPVNPVEIEFSFSLPAAVPVDCGFLSFDLLELWQLCDT